MLLTFCYFVPCKCDETWKKHPLFKENVDDATCLKNPPFQDYFGHGCEASHVTSDSPPPPPPDKCLFIYFYYKWVEFESRSSIIFYVFVFNSFYWLLFLSDNSFLWRNVHSKAEGEWPPEQKRPSLWGYSCVRTSKSKYSVQWKVQIQIHFRAVSHLLSVVFWSIAELEVV